MKASSSTSRFFLVWESSLRNSSLLFNPQFQSYKLLLGHALQSHRRGQIQSGTVFYFGAPFYLATEFLYLWVSAHFQKHFIRIADRQGLFNQAMLNQNAMIRRYCQRRWMGRGSALALSWVFHCTMLKRFLALLLLALAALSMRIGCAEPGVTVGGACRSLRPG